jgi:competence protein ComEC
MPLALVALVLLPVGLDAPALQAMALGIEGVLLSAATTSAWPMASIDVPQPPAGAVVLLSLAALWAVLWRGTLARLAVIPTALALLWVGLARPPDLVVDRAAGMAALRGSDGRYALAVVSRDGFVLRGWSRSLGIEAFHEPEATPGVACDRQGCRVRRGNGELTLVLRPNALALDCAAGAALVVNLTGNTRCPDTPTITRGELWDRGAVAVALGHRPGVRFVHDGEARRLWERDARR